MSSKEFVAFAFQIAAMLATALVCGQLMRRWKQPAVLGEMIGGILLGPTLLGTVAPDLFAWLFVSPGANVTVARDAAIKLGMLFFLFIAGLEIDLDDIRQLGRRAAMIGLAGTLIPLAAGVGLVFALPRDFWGPAVQSHFLSFALFIGMTLANSANPVIARILMDLGLLRGEVGRTIMTATIVDDLVNWTLFAIILSDIAAPAESAGVSLGIGMSVGMVTLFFVAVLGVGRTLGPPALRWIKGHVTWPTGLIGLSTLIVLVSSAAAEQLGIHAFLGAFLAGVALSGGDADHKAANDIVSHFALSFFAPLFFVSMGLTANFITQFDALLAVLILAAALASKTLGVVLGAWLARVPMNRQTMAIAVGLNARGATGIILAGVGLSHGVIDERLFVATVVMCLVTSLLAGPFMNALLKPRTDVAPQLSTGDG